MADRRELSIEEPLSAVFQLRRDLRIEPRVARCESYYLIEDPIRAKFYRLGAAEYELVSRLDGTRSVKKAIHDAAVALRDLAFSEGEALAICGWLVRSRLVERAHAIDPGEPAQPSPDRSWWTRLRNPLSIRVPLLNPTAYLDRVEPWLMWTLRKPFVLIWLVICLYALVLAGANWNDLTGGVAVLLDRRHWWLLVAAWLGLKLLHETYHALACRKYGGTVGEAGLFFLFFAPVPYVEVSSCWRFRSKWQRIVTAAAGMYIELFAAALAMVWWSHTDGAASHVAASIALLGSVGTLAVNANPLMRFDGYFILSDLLEIPNLSPRGRRWLASLGGRLLGCAPAPLGLPAGAAAIVKWYSVAAAVWRVAVWITLSVALLVLLARVHPAVALGGGVLIVAAAVYRAGISITRFLQMHSDVSWRRIYGVAAIGVAALFVAALQLLRPATIEAPGIVEYRPLVIVRSATAGFVREVRVHESETVAEGQPLFILKNDELAAQHRIAELEVEKSIAKCRLLRGAEETAQEQAELANQAALRKKCQELAQQIRGLTVLAPANGKLLGRNLDAWVGRYVETGTELIIIGDEASKEILVAVPQGDVELLKNGAAAPLAIRLTGVAGSTFDAADISLEPRATTQTPHEALSSRLDGPLAVRVNSDPLDPHKPPTDELLEPCFKASVALTADQSRRLFAGQLATVEFHSTEQTFAQRTATLVARWLRRAVEQ